MPDPIHNPRFRPTRRDFLRGAGAGLGALAAGSALPGLLSAQQGWSNGVAPRAKRVIFLCMAGGLSHLESFDWKPELAKLDGQPMPESFTRGQPIAQLQGKQLVCMRPQYGFTRAGQSGQLISEAFPHLARVADQLCIVRSMQTERINHDPAHMFMNTGSSIPGRPSMGSWWLHALGSESKDLPGFVVLSSVGKGGQSQPISERQWHSGFLPSALQGVRLKSTGSVAHYIDSPPGVDLADQRSVLRAIVDLDRELERRVSDPEIETRIHQYQLALRMQTSIPSLGDLSDETEETFQLYGTEGQDGSYAANCLLARRMAERGVRFIQLYHRGWDHHGGLKVGFDIASREVDQATSALITDLGRRGLLEDTLLVFAPEFGRTPMAQGTGRDHNIRGFSAFLCGGGVRPGITFGETDELGYRAVQDPVHVHDLHATMLHLFGIHHERLTYRYQGRDFRLTDVAGRVVHEILV